MLDTFIARLAAAQCGSGVDFLSHIPQFVGDWRPTRWGVGGKVLQGRGHLGNILVVATEQRLTLAGSLNKSVKGENITPITIEEAAAAVERLSAALNLPIERATVTRFDFGACMEMREPVDKYLQILGRLVYKKRAEAARVPILTGKRLASLRYEMQYQNKPAAVVLAIYDKIAEMKGKGEAIPEKYRGKNILRAEMRFCKSVASYWGMKRITVADLCSPTIWRAAVDIWRQTINQIEKMNNNNEIREGACESVGAFVLRFLRRSVAQCGGVDAFIEKEIKAEQKRGKMSKQVAYKCRKLTRRECGYEPSEGGSAIAEEFNKKVEETAECPA